ncbi:MAG TPA: hypothetical protein VG097_01330 [Gemmata sp.]|jgi:hypothetical protein|nr:hypothetical protein [Gemmata sp.]
MTVSIALVCDAPADRITIATLAERVIREAAPWVEPETIGDYVEWRGYLRVDSHLEWTDLNRYVKEHSLVVRFSGVKPLQPYSQTALRAIRVLAVTPDRVDAIVLVPDSDTKEDRLKGLEQARDYVKAPFPIIVGLAHTKRECWHISGFEPENDTEHKILSELRSELGFDVRTQSEELTAKHRDTIDKRSAKRVLAKLCGNNTEREQRCLTALSITELKKRGENNGLAPFLDELTTRLVPLFTHIPLTGN